MPRHFDDGPTIESDSFLDIVANIVGILIILIVIVGVRVGETAALQESAPIETPSETPALIFERPARVAPLIAPRPVLVKVEPPPLAPRFASAELVSDLQQRQQAAIELRSRLVQLEAELAGQRRIARELNIGLPATEEQSQRLAEEILQTETRVIEVSQGIASLRETLAELNRQITDIPAENTKVLKHRLNPIGRAVSGKELHFRLAGGQVSPIPIEALIVRLKPQIEKNKEWIARYNRHQGEVGPVDGYRMTYVVERASSSVIDDLRTGSGTMRIIVSGWKVEAEPSLRAETAAQAARSDSRFINALRLADRDTTITLWVYPDSFALYQSLEEIVHSAGLPVAARPMPHGVPIAGSPHGSRSTSQ